MMCPPTRRTVIFITYSRQSAGVTSFRELHLSGGRRKKQMIIPTEESVVEACQRRGISRRRFLEFCAAITATLALPPTYAEAVADALGQRRKPVLVWLEFQDCAGNT